MKKIIILVGEGDLPKIIIKFFLNKGIDFFCLGFVFPEKQTPRF